MKNFNQIQVKVINDNEAKVYLNLSHFKYPKLLGTLYRDSRTFKTIHRSYENLFHLYGFSGLGVNEEILLRLNFEFIQIPFNDRILSTTRDYVLEHAIPSNFVSEKVDKQLILDIKKFTMPNLLIKPQEEQEDMFEVENV